MKSQNCSKDKGKSLKLLPISRQTWRAEIGRTFRVVFINGRVIRARFLGETAGHQMLFRSLDDGALLLSLTTWDGRESRKLMVHGSGRARR